MWGSRPRPADGARTGKLGRAGGNWWNLPTSRTFRTSGFFRGWGGKRDMSLQGKTLTLDFSCSRGAVLAGSGSCARSVTPEPACLC